MKILFLNDIVEQCYYLWIIYSNVIMEFFLSLLFFISLFFFSLTYIKLVRFRTIMIYKM